MKKLFVLALLGIVLVVIFYNKSEERNLRFGLSTAPISLDPRFATDATSMRINRLLYRPLVDFDASLRPVPALATWEQLSPTHYRFHLGDKGREFQNGRPLTAIDVKATYDFILDEKNGSPHRGSLTAIKQIDVQDVDTVDFIIEKPDVLFLGSLTVGILPATLIAKQHPFNKQPVGSGDFEFVKWPQSTHLFLKRRRDGEVVEFLEIKDPNTRVLKLANNEVDILQNDLSPESLEWLATRKDIKISQVQGSNFTYLGFNLQDAVTGQFVVREAITYAINREEIIHSVLGDAARLAKSFLLPSTHWAGHPNLSGYSYDPDKARALLAQAGFSKENPLHLSYKTSKNSERIRIATVIQQQFAAVNIKMDIRSYDWGTFYGDIKEGNFQTYSLSWVGIKMPDIFRYVFHSSAVPPSGANRGRLNSPKIDALIEQAEAATTLEAGSLLYRELQVALFNELPYVPLWYEDHVLATTQRISGYTLAQDGNYDGLNSVRAIRTK